MTATGRVTAITAGVATVLAIAREVMAAAAVLRVVEVPIRVEVEVTSGQSRTIKITGTQPRPMCRVATPPPPPPTHVSS